MPDQSDEIDQTIGDDHMFCSHCGTENAGGGYSCTRCGERLIAVNTETASPAGLVSCARCGGANNTRAVYCWVCGTEMNDAVRISPAAQAKAARTASTYQAELNPISVPAPVREPKDERTDLRGPASGSLSGAGPGARVGPAPAADGPATSDEPGTNTSGMKGAEVPREIKRWNWAAFLVTPIWGIFSGVPFTALLFGAAFLPVQIRLIVVICASVFLGFRGNELAWRGKKWRSVEHFNSVQRQWATWAVSLSLAAILVFFFFVFPQS
ncbi:MAG: zinc ribbon domain-containing protein [Chloroflexi bacterium]|nr:zinc ribbon domain-containing protein [Chloroflexota bacterium]